MTGQKVTAHIIGKEMTGTIVSESPFAVSVQVQYPNGKTPTFRFTLRSNGEYKKEGLGNGATSLIFHDE